MSSCHNKDILNNKLSEFTELHLMTTVINIHKDSFMFMVLCHVYDIVMSVLCTPLQIKCYPNLIGSQ